MEQAVVRNTVGAALALVLLAAPCAAAAQERGGGAGQGRATAQGRGGRGQIAPPRDGLTPREIQAQFDAYVIAQAETALEISEDQYPQFVRRVRALQAARRTARVQRNRLLAELGQLLRARENADQNRVGAATRALDEQERAAVVDVQKAYSSIDEILSPWQRGRFRLLEDQLEQKKLDMLFRARQGPRR